MSSNDSQKLRNCPFCGSEGKLKVADGILDDFTMFYCYCPNGKCIAGGTDWFRSREEAIEAWNRRAERTCHVVPSIIKSDEVITHVTFNCSECRGHFGSIVGFVDEVGDAKRVIEKYRCSYNYCNSCGAKVVKG